MTSGEMTLQCIIFMAPFSFPTEKFFTFLKKILSIEDFKDVIQIIKYAFLS